MSESETFWDKASKKYDKTAERFEYIHSKSRKNTKKPLKDGNCFELWMRNRHSIL